MSKHDEELEARRQAEMERGAQKVVHSMLQQEFDPDYVPNPGISPELRRQRDEYRNRMRARVPRDED